MKKIYALILFACIANALATPFAHAHAPVIVNSAYCDNLIAQSHSPLYTITKNKRSATLLGTAPHTAAVLNDLIQEKYAALLATSDVLVTESGVPDYSIQASWIRQTMDLSPIDNFVDYDVIFELSGRLQMPMFYDMNFADAMLRAYAEANRDLHDIAKKPSGLSRSPAAITMKHLLIAQAERMFIPVNRLETTERIEAFKKIPDKDINAYMQGVLNSLRDTDEKKRQLAAVYVDFFFDAWSRRDIDAMAQIAAKREADIVGHPELALLSNMMPLRHRAMADRIDRLFDDSKANRYFIAIDAEHLGGEQGLLPLLKSRGYQITCQ